MNHPTPGCFVVVSWQLNSSLRDNRLPHSWVWNCCLPSEPLSSASLHSYGCVLRLSAQEMLLCLIPWVNPELFNLRGDRPFYSRLLPSMSCWQDFSEQDFKTIMVFKSTFIWSAPWIVKIILVCVPLFTLPYAWISRRDSCLVGVSCHIPSFWHCSRLASCVHHVYIFETWIEEYWKPQNPK